MSHVAEQSQPIVSEDQENNLSVQELALVSGVALQKLPEGLYIPPEALRVFLEAFEGPLDLLLYLIKTQDMDILSLSVAQVTEQYLQYINLMQSINISLAAEYLLMAAMLTEIKSRYLLPLSSDESGAEEDGPDPREQLIQRLQAYECFKNAAERLDELPRLERDFFQAEAAAPDLSAFQAQQAEVTMEALMQALAAVMKRAALRGHHKIVVEKLTVKDRMTRVIQALSAQDFVPFTALFDVEEGRVGVVVTLIAILELARESVINISQNEAFSPIYISTKAGEDS